MVNPIVFSVRFLKEVREEMKKVAWLTTSELVNYTVLVLFISVIVGAYLGALDLAFQRGVDLLLDIDFNNSAPEIPIQEQPAVDPESGSENSAGSEDTSTDDTSTDEQTGSEGDETDNSASDNN